MLIFDGKSGDESRWKDFRGAQVQPTRPLLPPALARPSNATCVSLFQHEGGRFAAHDHAVLAPNVAGGPPDVISTISGDLSISNALEPIRPAAAS